MCLVQCRTTCRRYRSTGSRSASPPELVHRLRGKGTIRSCPVAGLASGVVDTNWRRERHDWPGLSAIGKAAAKRRLDDGADSVETRYCRRGAKPSAGCARATARSAWRSSAGWLGNIARMHPGKRSVHRKFLTHHAARQLPPRHDPPHPQTQAVYRFDFNRMNNKMVEVKPIHCPGANRHGFQCNCLGGNAGRQALRAAPVLICESCCAWRA